MKKKLMIILGTAMLLMGCGAKQQETPQPSGTTTVGGWTIYEENNPALTEEESTRFNAALEGLVGVSYTPVTVLATQVVSGTNYAYLAKGTTVTAQPKAGYYVVVVYESLDGKTEVLSIKEIDVTDVKVLENAPESLFGGWSVASKDAGNLAGDASKSFEKVAQTLLGVSYKPLALLATQLVSGTNYLAICEGAVVTPNAKPNLYVIKWNENLQGNVEVLENGVLDLEYYLTAE